MTNCSVYAFGLTQKEYMKQYKIKNKKYLKQYIDNWRTNNSYRVSLANKTISLRNRTLINAIKSAPCVDCRIQYQPWQMQFDHRIPKTKHAAIADAARWSIKRLLKEIKKCDVVCANCHFDRTYRRRTKCLA